MQTLRVVVQFVLAIVLPLGVQLFDRRRLTAAQRARAWNGATWAGAVYAFGEFSMLGWYWVTRRWRGLPGAIATSLGLFITVRWLVDRAVVAVLGLERVKEDVSLDQVLLVYALALVVFSVAWAIALAVEQLKPRYAGR